MRKSYKLKYLEVLEIPVFIGGDECWYSYTGKTGNVYYAYSFDVSDEDKNCSIVCGKVYCSDNVYREVGGCTLEQIEKSIETIENEYED